ncbi:MAG: phosphoribosyltransferase [Paracoccus sp. (in: a-proteobacteria)]|nr:phosphoribosyltransferase [Paracoccus sp. (in: a-proteobacteria)]
MRYWQDLHDDLAPGVQPDQQSYAAPLGTRRLLLPIRALPDGKRGVASLIINQASFRVLDALADRLAGQLAPFAPDVVVGVPTLGLPLAEGVARRLGHDRLVALGTSRKFWYDEALSVPLRSITTPGGGKQLYLDPRMRPCLAGKRLAVVDDVLSSGASIAAVLDLLAVADMRAQVIGAAMLQGDAWHARTGAVPVTGAFRTPILTRHGTEWRET